MDEIRQTMTPEMKRQMELSVQIANRIYEIMEEKGLSQKNLASLLGKTETEVSRWLSGTHNLTLATIAKISVALNTDIICVTRSRRWNGAAANKQITEESRPRPEGTPFQ